VRPTDGVIVKDLLEFKAWAAEIGHYSALNAVNNYLRILKDERASNTSKDNKEAGERRPRCNQLDNCE